MAVKASRYGELHCWLLRHTTTNWAFAFGTTWIYVTVECFAVRSVDTKLCSEHLRRFDRCVVLMLCLRIFMRVVIMPDIRTYLGEGPNMGLQMRDTSGIFRVGLLRIVRKQRLGAMAACHRLCSMWLTLHGRWDEHLCRQTETWRSGVARDLPIYVSCDVNILTSQGQWNVTSCPKCKRLRLACLWLCTLETTYEQK